MNREIKFRVWNGSSMEYNIMVGKFGTFFVNPMKAGNGLDEKDSASLTPFNTIYSKETPVMQYTGLKDKNGKEIYEGDILDLTSQPEKICWYAVQWGTRPDYVGFVLQPIKKETKSYMHIPRDFDSKFMYVSQFEIIGNIYENKELLK